MLKGLLYATGACALWGLVFAIPNLLKDFSPFEIAFGRCLIFGLFSLSMLILQRKEIFPSLSPQVWIQTLQLSFVANIAHYSALVFGLHYANETVTTAILAINPIALACYGNWKQKEYSFRELALPCALSLVGIAALHFPFLDHVQTSQSLGIFSALIALATWVWFLATNQIYLKKHPIPVHHWVTINGVATLLWVGLASPLFITNFTSLTPQFIFGCAILGIGSSWAAHYFWNRATQYLPMALAGQLSILESFFGLLYIYSFRMQLPNSLEIFGVLIIFISIILALRNNKLIEATN